MATHSSIVAWGIQWTEEPGRLQSMELQKVRHDLVIKTNKKHISLYKQISANLYEIHTTSSSARQGVPGFCLFLCLFLKSQSVTYFSFFNLIFMQREIGQGVTFALAAYAYEVIFVRPCNIYEMQILDVSSKNCLVCIHSACCY